VIEQFWWAPGVYPVQTKTLVIQDNFHINLTYIKPSSEML